MELSTPTSFDITGYKFCNCTIHCIEKSVDRSFATAEYTYDPSIPGKYTIIPESYKTDHSYMQTCLYVKVSASAIVRSTPAKDIFLAIPDKSGICPDNLPSCIIPISSRIYSCPKFHRLIPVSTPSSLLILTSFFTPPQNPASFTSFTHSTCFPFIASFYI